MNQYSEVVQVTESHGSGAKHPASVVATQASPFVAGAAKQLVKIGIWAVFTNLISSAAPLLCMLGLVCLFMLKGCIGLNATSLAMAQSPVFSDGSPADNSSILFQLFAQPLLDNAANQNGQWLPGSGFGVNGPLNEPPPITLQENGTVFIAPPVLAPGVPWVPLGVHDAQPRNMFAAQPEDSPLYNVELGRNYVGFSQMLEEPSERISLKLESIREFGREVRATLSLKEGAQKSRKYRGTIDGDVLHLLPETQQGLGFGTFLTHMPWHSNSPTRITLRASGEGKLLQGRSAAGEQFELTLVQTAQPALVPPPEVDEFRGFDEEDNEPAEWILIRKNSKAPSDKDPSKWLFSADGEHTGHLVLMRGDELIATGRYAERPTSGEIDIDLHQSKESRRYEGRMTALKAERGTMRVTLPTRAGSLRPRTSGEADAQRYDLVLNRKTGGAP